MLKDKKVLFSLMCGSLLAAVYQPWLLVFTIATFAEWVKPEEDLAKIEKLEGEIANLHNELNVIRTRIALKK